MRVSQALLYTTVEGGFTVVESYLYSAGIGRMQVSTYHHHPLHSSVEECLTHLHLLYGRGMRVGQALLYTTVEEGFS